MGNSMCALISAMCVHWLQFAPIFNTICYAKLQGTRTPNKKIFPPKDNPRSSTVKYIAAIITFILISTNICNSQNVAQQQDCYYNHNHCSHIYTSC